MNLENAVITNIDQYFYRTVNYRYSGDPLSTKGAEKTGGRYNYRPPNGLSFPCLYCGEKDLTATTEKFYGLKLNNKPLPPHTVICFKAHLSQVIDISDQVKCELANIDWQEINQPWEYHQDILQIPSYTQSLGSLIYNFPNIEAIKFRSTKQPDTCNLAIFTTKLLPNSALEIHDPRNDLNL
ncbi:MAG: RES family NAD+ phosphorylase [Xenococcus sp. MO_188.B8]|nr:RES family NAD+ phosphorylase [Xenococcus sp. MO_188.B8]